MDVARIRAHKLGKMGQEGDHVMLGYALDLVNARNVELRCAALFPDRPCCLLRNDAEIGQRVAGMCLDLEPDAESSLWRPDGDHFRAGVTRDHGSILEQELAGS